MIKISRTEFKPIADCISDIEADSDYYCVYKDDWIDVGRRRGSDLKDDWDNHLVDNSYRYIRNMKVGPKCTPQILPEIV